MVVLPVPGGPHSTTDSDRSPSISWRSGEPGARSCCCPTSSSRVRGRIRTASGALAWVFAASESRARGAADPVPAHVEEAVHVGGAACEVICWVLTSNHSFS